MTMLPPWPLSCCCQSHNEPGNTMDGGNKAVELVVGSLMWGGTASGNDKGNPMVARWVFTWHLHSPHSHPHAHHKEWRTMAAVGQKPAVVISQLNLGARPPYPLLIPVCHPGHPTPHPAHSHPQLHPKEWVMTAAAGQKPTVIVSQLNLGARHPLTTTHACMSPQLSTPYPTLPSHLGASMAWYTVPFVHRIAYTSYLLQ